MTRANGLPLREILEVESLEEISLVVDPAYKSSNVIAVEMGGDNRSRRTPYPTESWREKQRPNVDYLRRQLEQEEMEFRVANEHRDNPHHDEDGKFHDGSPENILAAAQGRLRKAEDNHSQAVDAYNDDLGYPENELARNDIDAARDAHRGAIDGAQAAGIAAQAAHEGRLTKHQALIDASRARLNELIAQATAAPII